MDEVAIIGGGPAGLRVMQILQCAGIQGHLYEQKRSVGRKLLVAGKSGLNLTNDAEIVEFLSNYKGKGLPKVLWERIYKAFNNTTLREWARELGQETFVSSGKKVFPNDMKAAPLLRALVQDIKGKGGEFFVKHSLRNIEPSDNGYDLTFSSEEGEIRHHYSAVVLAFGGGSWSSTGSDGEWVPLLESMNIKISPLEAANCGWEVNWDGEFLSKHEGKPLKNLLCSAGEESIEGELVITKYGLEGGPIYRLGHALRQQEKPALQLDFKSMFSTQELMKKVESVRKNLALELMQRWRLTDSVVDLLKCYHSELFQKIKVNGGDLQLLAKKLKNFSLPLEKPRPLNEAISSAGGVAWIELDENLMLKKYPDLYACGEMLDWEAPTGGFLLQGCFSSASWVGNAIKRKRSL